MSKSFTTLFFEQAFMTASEASEIAGNFQCQTFLKDTVLFKEQESPAAFYIVKSGKVELRKHDSGRLSLVDLLVQGDFFGEMTLLEGKGLKATATVIENSELLFITGEAFVAITRKHPSLAAKILVFISNKLDVPARYEAFDFDEESYVLNKTIVISAPVSGAGRTFFATNFAKLLASHYKSDDPKTIGLVDLDSPFGISHLYFGVQGKSNFGSFLLELEKTDEQIDIFDYCTQVTDGVSLLQPPDDEMMNLSKGDVYQIIKSMKETFSIVLVIAPAGYNLLAQAAIDYADLTLIVSNYTIDGLARLKTYLRFLKDRPGYPDAFPVVINRSTSSRDARTREHDAISVPIIGRVPNSKLPPRSLKNGELLAHTDKKSTVVKAINDVVIQVTGLDCSDVSKDVSWLSAWFPFSQNKPVSVGSFPKADGVSTRGSFFRGKRGRSRLALGEALFIDGQYFRAFQELRRAIDDDPHLARAYSLLGDISLALGKKSEALDYFGAALKYDGDDYKSLAWFPVLKGDQKLLKSAVSRLELAISEHNDWADLYTYLAMVYIELGSYDKAHLNFDRSLKINPHFSVAHNGLAITFERENSFNEAIKSYRRALLSRKGNLHALFGLATLYESLALLGDSCTVLNTLVSCCPHHSLAQEKLMALHQRLEAVLQETGDLEAAVKVNPGFSDNLLRLGELYQTSGDFNSAVSAFKRALLANPDLLVAKERLLRLKALRQAMTS